jgi:sigma-E factor negative regulatory protein RseC
MDNQATVSHDGIVESISGTKVRVRFVAQSACAACHAKGVCSVSNTEEKFVEVTDSTSGFRAGDPVKVILAQRQGFKAVWYGYGLPLILLLLVIFIASAITGREGLSALIGLSVLIPYYLTIYLFRKRITRTIEFTLQRSE